MTIQMREGWVLCRNGAVEYAEPNVEGEFVKTHPWRLQRSCESVRNDGRCSIVWRNADSGHDVVELLDPWDARVPEEYRLSPRNCEAANATSHGPQRGPADLPRIRAQVAQTRRDLADAIDSLRANLRVLDGVDAELSAEQSSATTDATTEGGA